MKNHRRGRPRTPNYVTSWGDEIIGAYKGSDGRLRPVGRSTPAFGGDEAKAVNKFRRWQADQGGGLEPLSPNPIIHGPTSEGKVYWREYYRMLILTDPKQASIELDVPHLAWYPDQPEKPEFTLPELGEYYAANKRNKQRKPIDPKHRKNSLTWWREFIACCGVTIARDVKQSMIKDYHDTIMEPFDAGKVSPSWVRSRFVAVKAVINYGIKQTSDKSELRRLHDLCLILETPPDEPNPQPISPADFHALLDHAKPRERAILMLGLNAAMHTGEVAKLKTAEVSLADGTLSARRPKTSSPRVAKLWGRTVDAIRAYRKAHPHRSEFMFVTRTGLPMTGDHIRQKIVTIRERAGLPKTVTFEGLRDAALTIAEEVDPHHAKFLAGHKTRGESVKYVLRQATNKRVIACCEAIETCFFGGEEK